MKLSLLHKVSRPFPSFSPPPICIESRVRPIIQPFLFRITNRQQPLPHRVTHNLLPLPPLPANMLRVCIVRGRVHPPKVTLFSYSTPFRIPFFASAPLVLVRRRVRATAPVVQPVLVILIAYVTIKTSATAWKVQQEGNKCTSLVIFSIGMVSPIAAWSSHTRREHLPQ